MKSLTIFLFVILNVTSIYSQCTNTTQFPLVSLSVNANNEPRLISHNNHAGDYAVVTELVDEKNYTFTSSNPSDYLTLRSSDNTVVLAQGITPINYTSEVSNFEVKLHINLNEACDTEAEFRTTHVTCTNCAEPIGRVGINTELPEAVLDVNGEIRVGESELAPAEGMLQYHEFTSSFRGYTDTGWKTFGNDESATNELQVLSKSGDTIFLSNSNYILLDLIEEEPFEDSAIVDPTQQKRINEWIGNINQNWERCYQKTVDGATAADFHNNCDNRGPTLTIIELDNGRKFGGYTTALFGSRNAYQDSNESFLFSIDNDIKYPIAYNNEQAIYDHVSYGPTFGGGHDIYVNSSMNLQYINFPYRYARNGLLTPSNTGSQELAGVDLAISAVITELEVWVLKY